MWREAFYFIKRLDYFEFMHFAFTQKCRMVNFDVRRAQLGQATSDSTNWFLPSSKLCGVPLARFMTTSPLVARFPGEFKKVLLEELKNGTHLDRRVHKDVFSIASSFCIVQPFFAKMPETRPKTTRAAG